MEINEKLQNIVVGQLCVSKDMVKLKSSFVDDLGADSLDIIELVMAVEEDFDIEISDEDAEKLKTVKEAQIFLSGKGVL